MSLLTSRSQTVPEPRSTHPATSPVAPDHDHNHDQPQGGGVIAETLDRVGFTGAQRWVLILILAGMFFDTLEQNSVGAMGANLKGALGLSDAHLTAINTATVVGGLVGRLLGGWLADRYGRRTSLGFNLLLYTLGGLISALALNYETLLASRFLVGVGLGGEFTIGITMLSEMVSTKRRGTLVAVLNIGSGGVGNFLSYGLFFLLLGPLAPALGGDDQVWRWTFVFLALPALMIVFYRRLLPETPRFLLSKGRIDAANHSLAVLASDTLRPHAGPAPTGPLTAADIPVRQLPSSPRAVFSRAVLPRTLTLGAASWMAFGAQVTLNFLMPTLLVERGYSISESLLFTMIMNVGSLLGACAAALLAGQVGRRTVVSGAGVLGCLTAASFAIFADSTLLILLLGATFQFFTMITNTTLACWSPELYPTSIRATGTSIVNGIGNIAGAVMPFLAIALFHGYGLAGVFAMVAVMYALLVVASRFAPETQACTLEEINERALPVAFVPAA